MNIVAKKEKKFKLNGTKSQVKSILKTLIILNKDKLSAKIKYILISHVEALIVKILKRYKRLLKIYWAIDAKNKNYKQSSGIEEYSASDIYNMVTNLLENDGYKKVCKRTIERDIKLLNEMGLLQSKIRRLGKQKGSKSHYRQNMALAHIHKDIILEYLINLLKESLSDKKIIGDFDYAISEDENLNYTSPEKIETLSNLSEHKKITPMSHVEKSHVIKANISYINKENSNEMLSKKNILNKQKIKQCKFEKKDVEIRLVSIQKVDKEYLKRVKNFSNNNATYINALINLETAILDYKGKYNIEDILEHFLKQFANRYKHKIWMMMKRSDRVISDYELIWEERFKDWYPNKYKSNYVVKETYGENIRIRNKKLNFQTKKQISDNVQHNQNQDNEALRINKEREKERLKLELRRREEYLRKLFDREAQEMQERLKKAREEQYFIKEQARKNIIAILEEDRANNGSSSIIDCDNEELNVAPNNNLLESHLISDNLYKGTLSNIKLKNNYEGFKTTKGMMISLVNLGIIPVKQEKEKLNEKGKMI